MKSIGDIQERVQVIEEKLEGMGKQQERKDESAGKKVEPNKEGVAGYNYCEDKFSQGNLFLLTTFLYNCFSVRLDKVHPVLTP